MMKFKRWKKMIVMLLIATMFLQSVVVYADDGTSTMPSQTVTSDAQAAANDEPTTSQTPSGGSGDAETPADQDGKGDADNPADTDGKGDAEGSKEVTKPVDGEVDDNDVDADKETDEEAQETESVNEEVPEEVKAFLEAVAKLPDNITTAEEYDAVEAAMENLPSQYDALSDEAKNSDSVKDAKAKLDKLSEQLKDGRPETEEELSAAVKAFLDAVDAIEVPEEDLVLEENAELAEEFGEKIWTASDLFDALTEEEQELEEVQIAYMELNNFATVITGDMQTMALSNVVVAPNYNPGSCIPGVSKFGGSISKTVGESGFYQRRAIHDFHCPTCGWFFGRSDAKEYANFEVIQTNQSVISDISYEVGNLQGYPCLQMNFKGAEAGTTKVTLRYDVNFHTRWNSGYAACPSCKTMTSVDQYDDNWYHYEDTFYVTVTKPQQVSGAVHYFYVPTDGAKNGTVTFEMTNVEPVDNSFEWCYVAKPEVIDPNGIVGTYVDVTPAKYGITNGGYTSGWNVTISGKTATPGTGPVTVRLKYYDSWCRVYKYDTLKIVVYEPETITLKVGETTDLSYKKDVSGEAVVNKSPYGSVRSAGSGVISVENVTGAGKYRVKGIKAGTDSSVADYGYWRYRDYGAYAYVSTWYLDVVKFNVVNDLSTTTPVTIVKEFDGLTEDQIPENFSLEYTINGCSTCGTKNGSLKYVNATVTNANGTPSLVWNVDLPVAKHGTVAHTITFSESGAEVQGFKNPTLIGKTVTLESLTAEDGATKPVITVTNKYEPDNTMYVLSYDGMGGTGCPATQYTKIGNSTSHTFNVRGADSENPIKVPTHPQGYKFLGWAETDTNQELKYIYNSEDATYTPATITLTNANPSKTLYAVWEQRPHTVKPKLTGLDKVRVTDANEVNGAPKDVEYGAVIFRSDDGKVKLLYKITVSGTEDAKYKVTDEGAEYVSGGTEHKTETINGKDTLVVTGTLNSTGKAYIYVTKEFSAASGKLTNTAKLESNDTNTEGPGTGDGKDEKTDGGTDASEKRNVKVEFKIDPTDEDAENVEEGKLKDTFDKDYDKNGDFTYPGIEGKPSTVRKALQRTAQATTETLVIPWKITKTINSKEITFVLDETASKTALEKLSSLTTITENVTAELIYARDMKGNGTDNNGNFVDTTDGVPDKYQAKIIYDANGKGTINNKPNKQEYVTIYSNNDQTAMTTSGSVIITGATVVANSGQYCTGWTASSTDVNWSHDVVSGSTVSGVISVKGNEVYTFTAQYISAPTREEIPGILDPGSSDSFEFVIVDCVNTTIDPLHADMRYSLVSEDAPDVAIGAITANNGEYTCEVTVNAAPYVAEYAKTKGDHALADSTKTAASLTLKWNGTGWELKESGKNTVTFKVRCGSPSANVNITRNYKYTLDGVVTEQTAGPDKIAVEIKEGKLTITTGSYTAHGNKTYEFKSATVKKQDGTESSFTESTFEFDADTDKTYDVILNYELAEVSVKTVTIKYVDDEGNELKSELKLKGDKDPFKYGDMYDPSDWVEEGGTIDIGEDHYIIEKIEDFGKGKVKGNVTITVTCTRDNLVDPTVTKDPDDPDKGDGIPDKYQAEVTFTAVNGTLTGTTSVVVTLKDGDGNPAENGTATLTADQIPTATANDGYGNGTWTPGTPVEGYEITGKTDFVITFTANTPTPTPTPGGGDDPTPTPPGGGGGGTGGGGGGGTPDPTPTPPIPEITPLIPEIVPAVGPTTTVVPNVTPVAATPVASTPTAALVSPTPEAVELADEAVPLAAEEEKEQPEPVAVDEEETPLAGGKGAAWALINFALMNLAIFESVMLLIGYFVKTKNDEEEEKRKLKKKGIFRIISLPIAVISLIVFILTEDITLPTAFVDKYTIVMLIIAIVQTVMVALSNKKYEDEDEA